MTCIAGSCFIQQKSPCVYMACLDPNCNVIEGTWRRLPGSIAWNLVADVTEAEKLLTCDTNQQQVKVGSDVVEWSLEFESALCDTNWLLDYVLLNSSQGNPSLTAERIFYATWDGLAGVPTYAGSANSITNDNVLSGVAGWGTVNPFGYGVDGNNPGDAMKSEWSASLVGLRVPFNEDAVNCPDYLSLYTLPGANGMVDGEEQTTQTAGGVNVRWSWSAANSAWENPTVTNTVGEMGQAA